jgi:transposase
MRSGKSRIVTRRLACYPRLQNALYHWARVAVQHNSRSHAKYAALRERGHSRARALLSAGNPLLNAACAMLRNGTQLNPSLESQKSAC